MSRLLPALAQTNPGLFRRKGALVLLHLGMAFDYLRPHATLLHTKGSWQGVTSLFAIQYWGVLSLITAVLVGAGLYTSRLVAKIGLVSSLLVLGGLTGSFAYGATFPESTATGFFLCFFSVLVNIAALREPRVVLPLDEDFINGLR